MLPVSESRATSEAHCPPAVDCTCDMVRRTTSCNSAATSDTHTAAASQPSLAVIQRSIHTNQSCSTSEAWLVFEARLLFKARLLLVQSSQT